MATSAPGRHVWFDLMTTDIDKASEFYEALFGWCLSDLDMGGIGAYRLIALGEQGIGGMVALDPEQGVPSHWLSYATVENVDAAVETAVALGGDNPVPPTDIPEVGRFAVVQDPQGAHILPFTFEGEGLPEQEGMPQTGAFCWSELLTTDPGAASSFYGGVFGWDTFDVDMGEMGTYTLFKRGDKDACGMMQMPPGAEAPPHWVHYVHVESVSTAADRIGELGGNVFVPPTDIPNIGRFCVACDPTGAVFAVYRRAT